MHRPPTILPPSQQGNADTLIDTLIAIARRVAASEAEEPLCAVLLPTSESAEPTKNAA